jgi:hypothetical protein
MELDAIGAGLGGTSLASILITWGVIKSRVEKLWKLHDDLIITRTKVNTMWECWVEPALREGFVVRGLSLHLTEKGRNFLSKEIQEEIDSLLKRKEIVNGADPTVAVLNHLCNRLIDFAKEQKKESGIVFGTAQAYIEEVLRATPKGKSLSRRKR